MSNLVYEGSFSLDRIDFTPLTQLTAWQGKQAELSSWCEAKLGMSLPATGNVGTKGSASILSTGPNRWLVSGDVAASSFDGFDSALGTVLDMGSARTLFKLRGDGLARLLNKGTAVELDDWACPNGSVRMTSIDHVGVIIHKIDANAFDLYAFSSFADAMNHWLIEAGNDLQKV